MIARDMFCGSLFSDAVSTAGLCLYVVTFNQKVDREWIGSEGRLLRGTYIVKSSNSIISPNTLRNIYLKLVIYFPYLNLLLSDKEVSFIYFMSTHGHHFIYKADIINIINSFIEHSNNPVILNPYVKYSNIFHSLVISGIHYAPVSYEYHIHKIVPTNN